MKRLKKIGALTLAVLLVGAPAASALGESSDTEKEEVIYILTDASGQVTDVEAVNIFERGDVVDFGEYSAVKMLNTTDEIAQSGDKVTFSSAAQRAYYQGTMKDKTIPWNISIRYFLDGTEYSAADVAGRSGALEIRFSVSRNAGVKESFFDTYALQASFTLDTARCRDITAEGATVVSVGSDKQLTYTILPGKGIDTVIKADVTDFAMDAVSINGVRLSLDFDVDRSVLTDKVNELTSAADKLNDGAAAVSDGSGKLDAAVGTLGGKFGELHGSVGAIADGTSDLSGGLADIVKKNGELTGAAYTAYEGLCTAAAAALGVRLAANGMDPVELTPATYSAVLMGLLEQMDADEVYRQAYQAAQAQVTAQVEENADRLYRAYVDQNADQICRAYLAGQADALYAQAAAQAVRAQLMQAGYTQQQADAYLQTAEGQAAVAQAVAAMTDEQKAQIMDAAAAQLTAEQKEQLLQGAVASLTDEQKAQIREGAIRQAMTSDEVTAQIDAAVAKVSEEARQVSSLKAQLDGYGAFYQGLSDYTAAVSEAADGADKLSGSMDALHDGTGALNTAVGELGSAAGRLDSGAKTLADGAAAFADKTSGMDTQIGDEIDGMIASVTGSDAEVVSYVSAKNTGVRSVQFVIKTAAVEKADAPIDTPDQPETLTFWQKLLRLFGLY